MNLAVLYALVRDFAVTRDGWRDAIYYRTLPDERHDLTKVAQRVYGDRGMFLVIQAAAGLDSPELPLEERTLVLPTMEQLAEMKVRAGGGVGEGLV